METKAQLEVGRGRREDFHHPRLGLQGTKGSVRQIHSFRDWVKTEGLYFLTEAKGKVTHLVYGRPRCRGLMTVTKV